MEFIHNNIYCFYINKDQVSLSDMSQSHTQLSAHLFICCGVMLHFAITPRWHDTRLLQFIHQPPKHSRHAVRSGWLQPTNHGPASDLWSSWTNGRKGGWRSRSQTHKTFLEVTVDPSCESWNLLWVVNIDWGSFRSRGGGGGGGVCVWGGVYTTDRTPSKYLSSTL